MSFPPYVLKISSLPPILQRGRDVEGTLRGGGGEENAHSEIVRQNSSQFFPSNRINFKHTNPYVNVYSITR